MAFTNFIFSLSDFRATERPAGSVFVSPGTTAAGDGLAAGKSVNGWSYGWVGFSGTLTAANTFNSASGVDVRIAGSMLINTAVGFHVDLPPGQYTIQLPVGVNNSTGGTFGWTVFAGGSAAGGTVLASVRDITVAGGQVADTDKTISSFAGWSTRPPTTSVKITVTAPGGVTFTRAPANIPNAGLSAQGAYFRLIAIEPVSAPLVGLTFTNSMGDALTTLHANELPGWPTAAIASTTGAQNFVLTGTLATYYTIGNYIGSKWIIAGTNRMPDGTTGTLGVIQTDPASPGSPRTTWLVGNGGAVTLTSSQGRPLNLNHWTGQMSTAAWLWRKAELDFMTANEWPDWNDATDTAQVTLTANSSATFATAWNTINTTHANKKVKLLLQNGSGWTGLITLTGLDMGTGRLLIDNDVGHSPLIETRFYWPGNTGHPRKVEWRNLTFPMTSLDNTMTLMSGGMWQAGPYGIMSIHDCKFGRFFGASYDPTTFWNSGTGVVWGNAVTFEFMEQLKFRDNVLKGMFNALGYGMTRLFISERNQFGHLPGDVHACTPRTRATMPINQFDNIGGHDIIHEVIRDNVRGDFLDYFNLPGWTGAKAPHSDFRQGRIQFFVQWKPSQTVDLTNAAFPQGRMRYDVASQNVWQYDTGGTTGSAVPTAVTTGIGSITDGTATCHYAGKWAIIDVHHWNENNTININGVTTFDDGATRAGPGIQFIIDDTHNYTIGTVLGFNYGTSYHGSTTEAGVFNNLVANSSLRGIQICGTLCYGFSNRFIGSSVLPDVTGHSGQMYQQPCIQIYPAANSGQIARLNSGFNIVGESNGLPYMQGDYAVDLGSQAVNFLAGAASPFRPPAVLKGAFTQRASDGYWLSTNAPVDGIGVNNRDDMESYLSQQARPIAGISGAAVEKYQKAIRVQSSDGQVSPPITINYRISK